MSDGRTVGRRACFALLGPGLAPGLLLLVGALAAAAQGPADVPLLSVPPLAYRNHIELGVLGTFSGEGPMWPPSARLTLQRRQTLHTSVSLSGLALTDRLSRTGGLAVGGLVTVPWGRLLLEPFGEVGGGWTDARVDWGSYDVIGPDGGPGRVERYRAVVGAAAIGGVGVSLARVTFGGVPVRLTAGYWHVVNGSGVDQGSVRLGVSVGRASLDPRWYSLATDREPPTAVVIGRQPAVDDSTEVYDGNIRVLAADANGVAAVRVGRAPAELEPADGPMAERIGLPPTAVAATVKVNPPLGGMDIDIVVHDSAGVARALTVRVYAPPDRTPPAVRAVLPDELPEDRAVDAAAELMAALPEAVWPGSFHALAEDPSGIADAWLDACPLRPDAPPTALADALELGASARMLSGRLPAQDSAVLRVRDRAGNEARRVVRLDLERETTASPVLEHVQAVSPGSAAVAARRRSVRVRGTAVDPGGATVARVTVEGRPAVRWLEHGASRGIAFEGWITVDATARSVEVEAVSVGGRSIRLTVPITAAEPGGSGRLHVLLVSTDSLAAEGDAAALLALADESDRTVLVGGAATVNRVLAALVALERRVGPEDVALVRIEGTLGAGPYDVAAPSLVLGSHQFELGWLGRMLRTIDARATLVSASLEPGRTWRVPLTAAPGALPPAGCTEVGSTAVGAVVDLGGVGPGTIAEALRGAADLNADGRITVEELLRHLEVPLHEGLLPVDPLATLTMPGGLR